MSLTCHLIRWKNNNSFKFQKKKNHKFSHNKDVQNFLTKKCVLYFNHFSQNNLLSWSQQFIDLLRFTSDFISHRLEILHIFFYVSFVFTCDTRFASNAFIIPVGSLIVCNYSRLLTPFAILFIFGSGYICVLLYSLSFSRS